MVGDYAVNLNVAVKIETNDALQPTNYKAWIEHGGRRLHSDYWYTKAAAVAQLISRHWMHFQDAIEVNEVIK